MLQGRHSILDLVRFPHPQTSSHKAVVEVEVEFFHKFTKADPKSLMDHIQAMASGKAPFFPATLSLVYGKLFRKEFPKPIASGSVLGNFLVTGNQSTSGLALVAVPSSSSATPRSELLKCCKCGEQAKLQDLVNDVHCPRCPPGFFSSLPMMQCPGCSSLRTGRTVNCAAPLCPVTFI